MGESACRCRFLFGLLPNSSLLAVVLALVAAGTFCTIAAGKCDNKWQSSKTIFELGHVFNRYYLSVAHQEQLATRQVAKQQGNF